MGIRDWFGGWFGGGGGRVDPEILGQIESDTGLTSGELGLAGEGPPTGTEHLEEDAGLGAGTLEPPGTGPHPAVPAD